ncbi:hypothetical protein [Bacillus massilinigeriensis]|uniref:hypothetical protein n=1 Tax=Bacillus mediterraneensis TaxID=1805474 RepID=UPI0008F95870|nr:hypothetical protein [Bacillus mediterraneensis]
MVIKSAICCALFFCLLLMAVHFENSRTDYNSGRIGIQGAGQGGSKTDDFEEPFQPREYVKIIPQ